MRSILDSLFRGRHFHRSTGALAVILWGLLVGLRPEFLVKEGSLLFALAAVGGGFFIVFLADEKTWVRNYLLAAASLQVAFTGVCAFTVFWLHSSRWWFLMPLIALLLSQYLLSWLISSEKGMPAGPHLAAAKQDVALAPRQKEAVPTPSTGVDGSTEWKFASTKRFYEVYWFAMSVFGLTCDMLDRLKH